MSFYRILTTLICVLRISVLQFSSFSDAIEKGQVFFDHGAFYNLKRQSVLSRYVRATRLFIPKVADHVSACLYFVVKRSPICRIRRMVTNRSKQREVTSHNILGFHNILFHMPVSSTISYLRTLLYRSDESHRKCWNNCNDPSIIRSPNIHTVSGPSIPSLLWTLDV